MPLNFWTFPALFLIFIYLSIERISIQQFWRILAGNFSCFVVSVFVVRNLQVDAPKGDTFQLLLSLSDWILSAAIILSVNGFQWKNLKIKGMWWFYLPSVVILQFFLLIYSSRFWW